MNVLFCTDSNYVLSCGVAITSLLENNIGEDIRIFIVGLNLNDEDHNSFKNIAAKYRIDIEILPIENSFLDRYNLPLSGLASSKYITLAAYIRLFITDILPNDIDKILYLDCDLFINSNLRTLYDTSIEDYSLAGVIEEHLFLPSIDEFTRRLGYKSDKFYINSGVLLINLKYWRDNDIINVFVKFLQNEQDKIKYHDQDVINAVLNESFLILPLKYNLQSPFYQRDIIEIVKNKHNEYYTELLGAIKHPVIVHFTTFYTKPWFKGSFHPMLNQYDKYKELTEWKDVPRKWANKSFSLKFKYFKRKFLYATGLKKTKYISLNENIGSN